MSTRSVGPAGGQVLLHAELGFLLLLLNEPCGFYLQIYLLTVQYW